MGRMAGEGAGLGGRWRDCINLRREIVLVWKKFHTQCHVSAEALVFQEGA